MSAFVKYFETNRTLYNTFIDFKQAFDSVWQEGFWQVLRYRACKLFNMRLYATPCFNYFR